jgi:hypothetical protein
MVLLIQNGTCHHAGIAHAPLPASGLGVAVGACCDATAASPLFCALDLMTGNPMMFPFLA